MKKTFIFLCFFIQICSLLGRNNFSPNLSLHNNDDEFIVAIDSETHIDYGLAYPLTYKFDIIHNQNNVLAYTKFKSDQNWSLIEERTSADFFNGIQAVRFDYDNNNAFVSIAFSNLSDSIFIKFTDSNNEDVGASFTEVCKYYDDRKAVVTITADDWAGWNNQNFIETCQNFRSYNLWLSCAVITDIYDPVVWYNIQEQLDLGFVEIVSHSRTHPFVPYINVESEVLGSKQDIIENLELPSFNKYGIREYVYAWVAPYGEYDQDIDTLVSLGNYLVSRLFYWGDNNFSDWDNMLNKFSPVGASIEVGSSSYWGSTNIIELNSTFDSVFSSNGIYHLMTHPNILEWEQDFTWDHLEHISNRNDVWYVGFGHLYLYRFLSESGQGINLNTRSDKPPIGNDFSLIKNYPNPFNLNTTIQYNLKREEFVKIKVYNSLGNQIKTLVKDFQNPGKNFVCWDATNNQGEIVSAGLYFYTFETTHSSITKKMVLLK